VTRKNVSHTRVGDIGNVRSSGKQDVAVQHADASKIVASTGEQRCRPLPVGSGVLVNLIRTKDETSRQRSENMFSTLWAT
jgi:hypothetical protein